MKTDEQKKKKVLSKFKILCRTAFIAIPGYMWPAGRRLDSPRSDDLCSGVQSPHVDLLDLAQFLQPQERMTAESFMCIYTIYSCASMYGS